MRRGNSNRSSRHPLQPLSANELNKINRNNKLQHNYTKYDTQSLNNTSKRLNIEAIKNIDDDSMNEPPTKKRKSNQRSILSPILISDQNRNNNHKPRYGTPITSHTTTAITNTGNIGSLSIKIE